MSSIDDAREEASTREEPRGAKLFLGGLSWDTSEEKLREHFGAYGELVEAVVMRERATGRPRGFGFVTFKDKAVADRVVQDMHVIDGRQIDAKKSVPQEQKPKARKIFVGGIAPETTEADFKEYFEQFGPVTDAQIMQDHMTSRSRGFGFITFEEDDAVERVFAAGAMQELGGKRVEIKHATPKGAGSGGGGPSLGGGRGAGLERGGGGSSGSLQGGSGGRVAGFGRAAPVPFGAGAGMAGAYGFGMFPYPPGVMGPQAAGPYSMGYPSPYLMMQQISGYPGAAAFPFAATPGSYPSGSGQGRGGPPQGMPQPMQLGQLPASYQRQQGYGDQQLGVGRPQSHSPYPRPLAGSGRGKGSKVDSASSLSEHQPHRYLKS